MDINLMNKRNTINTKSFPWLLNRGIIKLMGSVFAIKSMAFGREDGKLGLLKADNFMVRCIEKLCKLYISHNFRSVSQKVRGGPF